MRKLLGRVVGELGVYMRDHSVHLYVLHLYFILFLIILSYKRDFNKINNTCKEFFGIFHSFGNSLEIRKKMSDIKKIISSEAFMSKKVENMSRMSLYAMALRCPFIGTNGRQFGQAPA